MSRRAITRRWIPAVGLVAFVGFLGVLASCDSERGVLDPGEVPGPQYEIADGSAVGADGFEDVNPYFFFLPPLVANPGKIGDSDGSVEPIQIEIFECDIPEPAFTLKGRRICGDPVRIASTGVNLPDVLLSEEVYQLEWDTDAVPIQSTLELFYRIAVSVYEGVDGPYPLGHVDVQFGANGAEVKNINQSGAEFFGLKEGRTVPVNFRIEVGATTAAKHYANVMEHLVCLDDVTGEIIDCDVRALVPERSEDQQLVVWANDPDTGEEGPAAVVTFTEGSIPDGGLTAVLEYGNDHSSFPPPSPEIHDELEIPPFFSVELFDLNGDPYDTEANPLGGNGVRVAWCHDEDDHSVDISNYAIYKVDDGETVLLKTGPGNDCLIEPLVAWAIPREEDRSFFGLLVDGLSKIAGSVGPEPLKAMHGGLNTEGPIRRLSFFGAVDATLTATVAGGSGAVGTPTFIAVQARHHGDAPEGYGNKPIGGDPAGTDLPTVEFPDGAPDYVGGEPNELGIIDFVSIEVVGGPNGGAEVSPVVFDSETGYYTASYVPESVAPESNPDQILVRMDTREEQSMTLTSQVLAHENCTIPGTLDCDVQILDVSSGPQQLSVWVDGRHPAGVVTFSQGSLPTGVEAVVSYRQINPPSPEIEDHYEKPPFLDVDLFQNDQPYDTEENPLEGDGVRIDWCHDEVDHSVIMDDYALYKVDDNSTVLLATADLGSRCLTNYPLGRALPPQPSPDPSFLGRLRDGLSRVAGMVTPEPLRAMHGGLNTEGPIRRLSEIGAVRADGHPIDGFGYLYEPIELRFQVRHPWGAGGSYDEMPIGGAGTGMPYVPGYVDEESQFLTILHTSGPNGNAEITGPTFNSATGDYVAYYKPTSTGTDVFTVDIHTRKLQTIEISSVVDACRPPAQTDWTHNQGTNDNLNGVAQSWVACESSSVTSIAFWVASVSGDHSGMTLEIDTDIDWAVWDPEYTIPIDPVVVGMNVITLPEAVPVVEGTTYAFGVFTETGGFALGSYGVPGEDPYPAGEQFFVRVPGQGRTITRTTSDTDLQFLINPATEFVYGGDSRFEGNEDGDQQVGSAGNWLTNDASVRLVVSGTNPALPVAGAPVLFSFRDLDVADNMTTDGDGYAVSGWQLGSFGGKNLLTISGGSSGPVEFSALAQGQISKWTAEGTTGWEDAVGVNDIGAWPGAEIVGVSVASGAGLNGGKALYFPPDAYVNVFSRDGFFQGQDFESQPGVPYNDNEFTLSAWVKLDRGDYFGDYGKFMVGANTTLEVTPSFTPGVPGLFKVYYNGDNPGAGEHYPIWSPGPMQLDCYHHIAATRDGSQLRAYLDGVLIGVGDLTGASYDPQKPDATGQTLTWVNHFLGLHGGSFVGHMDDAEIWNIPLSDTEISDIYTNTPVGPSDKCQPYALRGRILYSTTGVEGIGVLVMNDGDPQGEVASTTTNEFGDYYFETLPEGTYWVSAGPLPEEYNHSNVDQVSIGGTPAYRDIQVATPFSLTAPASGSTVTTLRPTLSWEPHPDAVEGGKYEIRMNERPGGGVQGDAVDLIDPTTTETSFTVNVDLEDGVTYRWHVDYREPDHRLVGVNEVDFEFTVTLGPPPVGAWAANGTMAKARRDDAVQLLDDGRVLLVGGTGGGAELFDPVTGESTTLSPSFSRSQGAVTTRLADGKVFIFGGPDPNAEIYDPIEGTFSETTGPPNGHREYPAVTLLDDGTILITGGKYIVDYQTGERADRTDAELFDPGTGTFSTLTESLNHVRHGHNATLLQDGRVLILGGTRITTPGYGETVYVAEIFDPATQTFYDADDLTPGYSSGRATLLQSGEVLVTNDAPFGEIFDPVSETFSQTGDLWHQRAAHSATLLPDGRVLIAGGVHSPQGTAVTVNSAELFDPAQGTFVKAASMAVPRQQHAAVLLPDGRVLVLGGYDFAINGDRDSVEVFDPGG